MLREQQPLVARVFGVIGLMCLVLGVAPFVFKALERPYLIPTGWGVFLVSLGLMGLLFHAYSERDFQLRRLYGALAFLLLVAAAFLRVIPYSNETGGGFLPYGALSLFVSLGFWLAFVKNETEIQLRSLALTVLGGAGLVSSLIGLIGTIVKPEFLLTSGVIHLVLGLLFAAAYVGMEGIATPRGFWAGRGIGILGLAMVLVALGLSLWPTLFDFFKLTGQAPKPYFLPFGLILMYVGAEYLALYLGICSDNKLVVLTRRESRFVLLFTHCLHFAHRHGGRGLAQFLGILCLHGPTWRGHSGADHCRFSDQLSGNHSVDFRGPRHHHAHVKR